jgi:hypothetical protein
MIRTLNKALAMILTLSMMAAMLPAFPLTAFASGSDGNVNITQIAPDAVNPQPASEPAELRDSDGNLIIYAVDGLPDDVLAQRYALGSLELYADLTLPDSITGYDAKGNQVTIDGVAWYCPEFDPYAEEIYMFVPVLPGGYTWAEGVKLEFIMVQIYLDGTAPGGITAPGGVTAQNEIGRAHV